MKLCVLMGSPRKDGNTAALITPFLEECASLDMDGQIIWLYDRQINPCLGCKACQDCLDGLGCVQKDGFEEIFCAMADCDVIVLATPLYYWNMSGQLRTAVDRLFALEEGGENLLRGHGRASALLMAAEGHDFDDAARYYDHLMVHLQWENLGKVLCGGVMSIGDFEGRPEISAAYELGKSIV